MYLKFEGLQREKWVKIKIKPEKRLPQGIRQLRFAS